jgi:hypothetical protein
MIVVDPLQIPSSINHDHRVGAPTGGQARHIASHRHRLHRLQR